MIRVGKWEFRRLVWRDVVVAFLLSCVGMLIMFLSWSVGMSAADVRLGGGGLWHVHMVQPSLWIVDLLPITLFITYLFFRSRLMQRIGKLQEELEEQRELSIRNAEFAKSIGEGNYDVVFDSKDGRNLLGKSLLSMRDNLRDNNRKEAEGSWVTSGKEAIGHVLRLHNRLQDLAYDVLRNLIGYINVVQGGLYLYDEDTDTLVGLATYAYNREKLNRQTFRMGEGLVGQCAYEQAQIHRTEIPEGYMSITSGILGDASPRSLLLVPLITDEKLQGVVEFASLRDEFSEKECRFLEEVGETIARTVYNLRINQKTESLLHESQKLTLDLTEKQDELKRSAENMKRAQLELENSNAQLEAKISEAENAQKRLHSLLENASEVITIYNTDRKIAYISPSVTKILGYTTREMESGKDRERLTEQGREALEEMFQSLIDRPMTPVTTQYVFLKKDGEKVWMEVTGRNMVDNPAIQGLILNSRDITERLWAEKEERMKSKMQSLSENSVDMIVRMAMDGLFYYANPVVSEVFGVRPSEVVNRMLDDVPMPVTLRAAFIEMLDTVKNNPQRLVQEVEIGVQENRKILHLMAIPEFDEEVLETVLFVGHDITEAKRIEREIQDKNRKIKDSINYAERIQKSILPDMEVLRQAFPKSFMFYEPRDVVSGDFPWFFKKDEYLYIAAVDCTGHGVPGALLSFIGFFILNNVVDHDALYSAGQVLDHLHWGVRTALRQDREGADARDGMDIALCKVHLGSMTMEFAGAHRPLYFVRNGELKEYKGDRRAIGGIPNRRKPEGNFTNHQIAIEPGDRVFFFSDGLPDQLGGESGMKKYSPQHVREVLVAEGARSMEELGRFIESDFLRHMGNCKRIDDVLLIGIEF